MNWGKGILIFIIVFLIIMMAMVYVAFQQSNEMIEENYYVQELKYQSVIDAKKNLKTYKDSLQIIDSPDFFTLIIPAQVASNIQNGTLKMVKYDNIKHDKTVPFKFSTTLIPKKEISKGLYHLQISWLNNSTPYFYEIDREFH